MGTVSDDDWAEWVAHNLAHDVPAVKLEAELGKNGYTAERAAALVADVRATPAYRAAERIAHDLSKWTTLCEVLLDLEKEVYPFDRIPRVSAPSEAEFVEKYYATNRPVIIEDVVSHWPACQRWSLDFLKEHFGAETVRFQKRSGSGDHREAFVDRTRSATLAEYIDLIRSEEGKDCYLIAHDRLLDKPAFRPLLQDLPFDDRYFDVKKVVGRTFLWVGPPGSTTPMHRDLGNVYFAQISGEKRVKMVPSKQLHLVYNETGYHSEVDFSSPSLADFPLLKNAMVMDEIIKPGELLFIPVGWWHWVQSLGPTMTVTGSNFKFRNTFTEIF